MNLLKQKKSIYFLLLVCMLFLGMCVENIQADSFFSYESSAHAASTLLYGERTSLTAQEYPAETISRQECITSFSQVVRRSFNRSNRGSALILLFVDSLPQISPFIQTSSVIGFADKSSCSTIIVNYIHHKDGKKA